MARRTFRIIAAGAVLHAGIGLGLLATPDPAHSQGADVPKDRVGIVAPPDAAPMTGICRMPLALLNRENDHRVLAGNKAAKYIKAAGVKVPPGTDSVAYKIMGNKVGVLFVKTGCVVNIAVVPAGLHRKVMTQAFGWAV